MPDPRRSTTARAVLYGAALLAGCTLIASGQTTADAATLWITALLTAYEQPGRTAA